MKKNIIESILEKLKDKNLYIFLGVTLLFFGIFIIKDYTVDSYLYFQETWKEPFIHIASLGRLVTAFFWLIFSWTNFNVTYIVSFIIAIVATTLSMYKLNQILKRDIKNEKITILLSILVVINICTLELYMFFEKGIMLLSVLMIILAIGNIEKALHGNKKAWIIILIEMFIANCCYQGTVGLFIAIGTIYVIKNSNKIGAFIKNNIILGILYVIPALLNLCIVKFIFHSSRLEESIGFAEKMNSIFQGTVNILIHTFDIIPSYLLIGILIGIIFLFIIKVIKKKEKWTKKSLEIILLGYVIIGTIIAAVAPQIMQAFVYMVPRNVFSLGAILGIILILLYHKMQMSKVLNTCILVGGIIFLSIQFFNFIDITLGHYYTNQKDKEIADRIAIVVNNYEKESGKVIKKVVIYKKEKIKTQYDTVRYNGDANVRAFFADWGTHGILDRALNRDIKIVDEKKESFEEIFKGKDWNYFDEEQVILENDTLHLCII